MDCQEIVVWLEREKLQALEQELAQHGNSTTSLLQERLCQMYEETVPVSEQQRIEELLAKQARLEELEILAARRFAAVRVTEGGVTRCFELDGYRNFLNIANACSAAYQRKKAEGEQPVRLPFHQMAFQKPIEISADAYQKHCRQADGSHNVTLTADIDCDEETLEVSTEAGELRYPLDAVVKAVRAAYRKQGLRTEGYQERLMAQLERRCPSQPRQESAPTEDAGPKILL